MDNPRVLITDVDNTLLDWQDVWYRSFSAMMNKVIEISGVEPDIIYAQCSVVHQKYGTSEYSRLLSELPCLTEKYGADVLLKMAPAIEAFRKARKSALKLYPTVKETLQVLRDAGVIIVAFTESKAFYTNYRFRKTGLDSLVDYLYSPTDHDMPNDTASSRLYENDEYELKNTKHRYTPEGEIKPNKKILLQIIADLNVTPKEVIYVGDNILKDVYMAQDAGVTDVHALYGASQHKTEYELLRKVTHWTPAMVEEERNALKPGGIKPKYVLDQNFAQILPLFGLRLPDPDTVPPLASGQIEIWKKIVDVQQHFNDLELRIRNFALVVTGAFLGLGGYAIKDGGIITLFGTPVSIAGIVVISAILPLFAFYFMDRLWYHRLLDGAVAAGVQAEKELQHYGFKVDLGSKISEKSPFTMWIFHNKINSKLKMDLFYGILLISLIIVGILIGFGVRAQPQLINATNSATLSSGPGKGLVSTVRSNDVAASNIPAPSVRPPPETSKK